MSESNASGVENQNEWSSPPRQTAGPATFGHPAEREIGEQAAETIKHEAVKEHFEVLSDNQREFMAKTAQRFEEASRKLTDASENGDEMWQLMSMAGLAGGLQDMQRSLTGLVEGVMRTNLRIAQKMFLVQSSREYIELQQQFVREYLDGLLYGFAMLAHATRRTANDTVCATAGDRTGASNEFAVIQARMARISASHIPYGCLTGSRSPNRE